MTVKITSAQADILRRIRRGQRTSPPLPWKQLKACLSKGLVEELVVKGEVVYIVTEEGLRFS